jgi:NADH:ubiquinone oxidoreductase subunit 5 (subunit L)/multisubunit Na+/H+ antiporter MnhA subunit
LLLVNTSNKIKFLQPMRDQRFCKVLYNKYYVDEAYDTIFVKTTNGLSRFFRDHVETTLSSLVLIRKSNQRNRLSRKKIQTGSIGFYLCICFRTMCHFLFIYRSIILYYERISNINYTFSWRICILWLVIN